MFLDLFEVSADGRIAGEINVSRWRLNYETAPQGTVKVAQTAAGEMLSRDTIHSNSIGHVGFVPPIEFYRIGYSMILKQRSIAQPGDEACVVLLLESEQRCDVQMIVVVVTKSTTSIGGRSSKRRPGARCLLGPAQVNGLARSDQIGSVRMFKPAV